MVKDIKFLTFYSIICPLPPSTVYHRSLVHYLPRRGLIPKAYNTNEYTLPGVLNCFSRYFLFLFFFFFYFYFHFFYLLFFLFYSSFFLSFFFFCLFKHDYTCDVTEFSRKYYWNLGKYWLGYFVTNGIL